MAAHDGDGWTVCSAGHRHWGRFGAAGLLLGDERQVILQHRAEWTHEGGTWGLPGGARDSHEDPVEAALREALEEGGIPGSAARPAGLYRDDHGSWSYTTVLAELAEPVMPAVLTRESTEIRWWPRPAVHGLPLHAGLAALWPLLNSTVRRAHVVIDTANVLGARPDGWWTDRAAATRRLLDRLAELARAGIAPVELPGVAGDLSSLLPRITIVIEGRARAVSDPRRIGWWSDAIEILRADGSGDDRIVAAAELSPRCYVVTADRGLRARLPATATALGPRWLWRQLDGLVA